MDSQLEAQTTQFFQSLSQAVDSKEVSKMLVYFHQPTIFISNGAKIVCMNDEELRDQLGHYLENEGLALPYHHNPTVLQALRLSSNIYFVQVNWQWLADCDDHVLSERRSSYTLQKMKDGEFSIVVSVVDTETLEVTE